ncbi:MAG: methyltransferase domain-containing protein [Gemmatimonadota bacterium]
MRTLSVLLAAIGFLASPAAAQETPVDLNDPARSAEDRARDPHSKPIEVFQWIGLEPGAVVVDFHAGSGYNTWVMSKWVGPEGVVYTEMPERMSEDIKARLESGDLAGAGNVIYVDDVAALPTDSLDLFFTSRNYHDVDAEAIPEFLTEVRRTLAPGGLFVVIDARAAEGRDTEAHRIADQVVIDEVTAAGLELIDQSELLANPDDDHVGPKWDQREQLDQSLIKFRSPEEAAEPAGTAEPAEEAPTAS